ncbi:GMC oxidoreductase [Abortiporus biennis]|nr:GMC oxidoreductase [Abortiporus biennis]
MGFSLSRLVVSDPAVFATKVKSDDPINPQEAEKWHCYDYVVAGGGTAGCVIASRLSEDPNVSVLLIEAGKSEGDLFTRMPLSFTKSYKTDVDWDYYTERQDSGVRVMQIARGKVLGGTSVLNAMVYDRCTSEDFDSWARNGAEGWTFKNIEPYFRKAERYLPKYYLDEVDFKEKGCNGPLCVRQDKGYASVQDVMIETCETLGMKYNKDISSHDKLGVGRFPGCIDSHGARHSTAAAYLTPEVLSRPNLTVAVNTLVEKIIFSPSGSSAAQLKAIGVQVSSSSSSPKYRVRATKEVVVCGGAINSPHLLLLSGVGPKNELEKLSIPCLIDLPVGRHFVDHISAGTYIVRTKPGYTLDYLTHSHFAALKGVGQWLINGSGVFSQLPVPGAAYVRTDDSKLVDTSLGEVKDLTSGPTSPDLEILWTPIIAPNYMDSGPPGAHGVTISAIALKAESEGSITLKTNNPWDKPLVNGNYLSSESDINTLVRGMRLILRLTQTEPLKSILQPDPIADKGDIFWRGDTDPSTAGTCSIGPVLSPSLVVHGTTNVRVVDASIFPTQVSGHPMAVIVAMAERAADLMKGLV